jgi:ArsR family metal-binding transcriptional regulator
MTRAVIKLKKDISNVIPIIAEAISTAAFNADIPVASFRHKDWRVIINKREILVKDIAKEADAVEVMNYLKDLVAKGNKDNGK